MSDVYRFIQQNGHGTAPHAPIAHTRHQRLTLMVSRASSWMQEQARKQSFHSNEPMERRPAPGVRVRVKGNRVS